MKNTLIKITVQVFAVLAVLITSLLFPVNADAKKEEYNYGFITSCGHTEYYTSDHELSGERLAELLDEYEKKYCNN